MNESAAIPENLCRFRKFTLQALLVLVTATGVSAGWFIFKIRTLRSEAEVARAIRELGGLAFFDEEADGKPLTRWFPRLRGAAFYSRSNVRDADIVLLHELSELDELFFDNVQVTDDGVAQLRQLTKLRSLQLSRTGITDAGLIHLHGLTNLEWLDLRGTKVTDSGIIALRRSLPHCKIEHAPQE